MNIYLKHPVHGTKIAFMDLEAEADEENGWVRYNPEDPDDSDRFEDDEPSNALRQRRRRRTKAEMEAARVLEQEDE